MTPIDTLSTLLSKLPGLGPRSARRAVLHLFKNKEKLFVPLIAALSQTLESIKICELCGNLDTSSPCHICTDARRPQDQICVVEEVADLWAIERSGLFKGMYHVLGGTLSAMDGRGPEQLGIPKLFKRAEGLKEVILATNATVDGQTTAFYITEQLKPLGISVTRIAYGIPVGGELDYLDEGTLGAALKSRQSM